MINPVILAVDDRPDNLFVLKQLIVDNFTNCILFTADCAEKGLEIARESKLDIVITDVQMPRMNGIDFCRILKSTSDTSETIVLLVTAHKPEPELVAEGLNAGAFDFITKPIENVEITARINAALRIKNAEVSLKKAHDKLEENVRERTADLEAINLQLKNEIEERETIEKTLRETNQRMMTAMEGTGQGIWDADLESGAVTFGENWAKILGYDIGQIQFDRSWWDRHVHPDFQEQYETAMDDYLSGKEKYFEMEYRIKTRQEEWIWAWARGICVEFDDKKNPLRMIGTQRDITEKRKAEEAYHRLVTAIEQVEDAIIITDSNATIQYVNPSFEKITGYKKDEVEGNNPRMLKSGAHEVDVYQKMWNLLLSGKVWSGKLIDKRKDGSSYNVESTITPVKNQLGEISNYVSVQRDVTHQVKLERQLRQAQKMEAIGTLAGGIAHDFNNLLFAILGYNSLSLKLLDADHPVHAYLQKLEKAAERAKELVSQILTFSRQSEQDLKPVMMQPIIREALKLLRATIPSSIEVNQEIAEEGGLIMGNETHLHQIIINLATNAYQAMRDAGGALSISLKTVLVNPLIDHHYQGMKPGLYAELKVSDTGCGMDPDTLDRIFEPYFSTKEQGEGTGMGLSIIHGIIVTYQGKIFVESEVNTGTTFRVLIPEIDTVGKREANQDKVNENELRGSGKILIVDDEEQISEVLKQMLEDMGYSARAYTSSEQLLEDFKKDPYQCDAIITDLAMPKMTGAKLASELLEIRPSLPIILCTGYSDSMDDEAAKKLGISQFVMKPISFRDLAKTVKKALNSPTFS